MSKELKELNAIELLALSKVKAGRSGIEPGTYEGSVTVQLDYLINVAEDTTVSRRKGNVAQADALLMAVSLMTAEQREELSLRMTKVGKLKGAQLQTEVGMNANQSGSKFVEAHYPRVEASRAGAVKAKVELFEATEIVQMQAAG